LLKTEQSIYLWGKNKNAQWKLTLLRKITANITFPKEHDQYQLISGKYIPKEVYKKIELVAGHVYHGKVINERFTFHDIRRKIATDLESKEDRETARKLLGHSDQKMTERYISGVQKVLPLE